MPAINNPSVAGTRLASSLLPTVSEQPPDTLDVTPDGRYFVIRGRLWRMSNPSLDPERREQLVSELMAARRAVKAALAAKDAIALRRARSTIDRSKRALGERGPVWWDDGAPDYNRHMAVKTPYAAWFEGLAM
ncbi:MAG TPA: hypothetical protein VN152_02195 [Sphingopyxis sp.]|nr:hypothetical protein [Sphingopyxis sp.]